MSESVNEFDIYMCSKVISIITRKQIKYQIERKKIFLDTFLLILMSIVIVIILGIKSLIFHIINCNFFFPDMATRTIKKYVMLLSVMTLLLLFVYQFYSPCSISSSNSVMVAAQVLDLFRQSNFLFITMKYFIINN